MTNYLSREITSRLTRALRQLPVVVLSGLRQAGKSTLLQNEEALVRGHTYRTLDDFATLTAARTNPESLLDEPAILDEVQRCPELLITLKRSVDDQRKPGRFVLSGSANLALLGHVSETLAGRAVYFSLHPMTRRERRGETAREPFLVRFLGSPATPSGKAEPVSESEVLRGGLPPACLGQAGRGGGMVPWLCPDLRRARRAATSPRSPIWWPSARWPNWPPCAQDKCWSSARWRVMPSSMR